MIVPIYRTSGEWGKLNSRAGHDAHGEVFGEGLDTTPFAGVLAVKPFRIELIAQTQCLVLFVQAR